MINLFKIFLTLVLSSIIGWEREKEDKPAGLRTCILVAISMTFLMILNLRLFELFEASNIDITRLPSYCIAGIGFLGSGIIILNKKRLEGITTATTMLSLVVIGLLCGLGEFALAITLGSLVFITLQLKYIKIKIQTKRRNKL